jgi:hypothetical protein
MSEKHNQLLQDTFLRLEKVTAEVMKTEGYTSEVEKLKILVELTREQVKNEDSDSTAR